MALSVGTTSAANASYASIGNYAQAAGIGNTSLTEAAKAGFDPAAAALGNAPFSTSTNIPDFGGDVLATPAGSGSSEAWVFITAPGTVSYSQQAEVTRLDIFGTNAPPVVVGAKGMRDLTLSDALMEGFTLGRSVQPHIDKLEQLMDVSINTDQGFVNVPVYNVFAGPSGGGKNYGYFVIEQVEIEEQMRDLKGNATRAMVGVSLKQVPKYQVGTGIDQAGASTGGAALDPARFTDQASGQDAKVAGNKGNTAAGKGGSGGAGGGGGGADGAGGGGSNSSSSRFNINAAAQAEAARRRAAR
jgi:hypothetical protein